MTNHLITHQLMEQRRTAAITAPGSDAFRSWASDLAHVVAEHGLAGVERAVTDVSASARRRGLEPTCVEIVADRAQPSVAHERAFGHILTTLAAWCPTTAATSDVA